MEAPVRPVFDALLDRDVRPVEERIDAEGNAQTLWICDTARLPPLILVFEGSGDHTTPICEEIDLYRRLDLFAPTINVPGEQTGVIYEVGFRLDPERTVIVYRKCVGYPQDDTIWRLLAHQWIVHRWYIEAYVEAQEAKIEARSPKKKK